MDWYQMNVFCSHRVCSITARSTTAAVPVSPIFEWSPGLMLTVANRLGRCVQSIAIITSNGCTDGA